MIKPLMPLSDAGKFLGYTGKSSGKTTMYKLCKQGHLTKVKIGGRSFVLRESAERLIRDCTEDKQLGSNISVEKEAE